MRLKRWLVVGTLLVGIYATAVVSYPFVIRRSGPKVLWSRDYLRGTKFRTALYKAAGFRNSGVLEVDGVTNASVYDFAGQQRWSFASDVPGEVAMHIAVGPLGRVYAGTSGNRLVALDDEGAVQWSCQLPGGTVGDCAPAVGVEGTVTVASPLQRVTRVDAAGHIQWSVEIPGASSGYAPVLGPDGASYVPTLQFAIACIDQNGRLRWSTGRGVAEYPLRLTPDGELIAYKRSTGTVVAIDGRGAVDWKFECGRGSSFQDPIVTGQGTTVALKDVPGQAGQIVAVDTGGQLLWQHATRNAFDWFAVSTSGETWLFDSPPPRAIISIPLHLAPQPKSPTTFGSAGKPQSLTWYTGNTPLTVDVFSPSGALESSGTVGRRDLVAPPMPNSDGSMLVLVAGGRMLCLQR